MDAAVAETQALGEVPGRSGDPRPPEVRGRVGVVVGDAVGDPGSAYDDCDLHGQAAERAEILADLWEAGEERPDGLTGAGARVLPWAFEEGSGAFLYWLVRPGRRPEEWTVLYNEGRGPLWEHHTIGCVAFLRAALTGTVESEYFGGGDAAGPVGHRFDAAGHVLGQPQR